MRGNSLRKVYRNGTNLELEFGAILIFINLSNEIIIRTGTY